MGCNVSRSDVSSPQNVTRRSREGRPYRSTDRKTSESSNSLDTSTLSQTLLNDLRVKQKSENGSPVSRWIEAIAEPTDTDNVDLYDPMRRHRLAMDSIAQRQQRIQQLLAQKSNSDVSSVNKNNIRGDAQESGVTQESSEHSASRMQDREDDPAEKEGADAEREREGGGGEEREQVSVALNPGTGSLPPAVESNACSHEVSPQQGAPLPPSKDTPEDTHHEEEEHH